MKIEIHLTTDDGEELVLQTSPIFEPFDFLDTLEDTKDDLVERLLHDGLNTL